MAAECGTNEIYRSRNLEIDPPTVVVLVNPNIRAGIQSSLGQFVSDLENLEGYSVIVTEILGGSPAYLRDYLSTQYNALVSSNPLVGCILIGNLPLPMFKIDSSRTYPLDMYYMDLNGQWNDADGDGVIDQHPSEPRPDIWVGRLTAGPLAADEEIDLLNRYFAKNHKYRIGAQDVNSRAMAYVDDDWIPKGDYGLSSAYSNVTVINDVAGTNAADYKAKLTENYEFLHLAVHSSPSDHSFKDNNIWNGHVNYGEIRDMIAKPIFYCLDACRAALYTQNNYIGGWYVFSSGKGLAVIGETVAGSSMQDSTELYTLFGQGKSLGESFITWLRLPWLAQFHIDRTILGDPTLRRGSSYHPVAPGPPGNLRIVG